MTSTNKRGLERAIYERSYRIKNAEKIKAYHREEYQRNKSKHAAYSSSEEHKAHKRRMYAEKIKDPDYKLKVQNRLKEYRLKNLEKCKAMDKSWRKSNLERCRNNSRAWTAKNKEKDLEYHRASYRNHKIKRAATHKRWRENNIEYAKQINREYLQSNPGYNAAKSKRHYEENKSYYKNKAIARYALRKKATVNLKGIRAFVDLVKSRKFVTCYYCEKPTPSFGCHFDHIVALSKGGQHSADNLCVSCPKCNLSKNDKSISDWKRSGQLILSL